MSAGIIENIDIFFIQRSLNIYETGLYSGVSRIAMMITLIAYSMGNVLYPRVAKYKSSDHLGRYLKKASGVALLALLGFLAFLPISRWVIFFTIGPDYLSGQVIMNLLALSSFLVIASIPFVALFYTLKATWYFSVSAVLQLIIVLVGNFYYVPLYGLEAAAWTRLVTRLFLFTFTVITGLVLYQREYGGRTQKNLA
jgi:O-antigen/teichoic acid export membrane protein